MMLFIVSAHIAAVAAIMSAKMDLPKKMPGGPTIIRFIQDPLPPPEHHATRPQPAPRQIEEPAYTPPVQVPTPGRVQTTVDSTAAMPQPGPAGPDVLPPSQEQHRFDPAPVPASTPAQPLTAASDLKPPYPESKLLAGEEAR
jgi:hypothetical protein